MGLRNFADGDSEPRPLDMSNLEAHRAEVDEHRSEKFMGVTLRGWAISSISLIAVLSALGVSAVTVFSKYQSALEDHRKSDVKLMSQNENLVGQLTPISAETSLEIAEAAKHHRNMDRFNSVPIQNSDEISDEIVTADYYPSDKCLHITRVRAQVAGQNGNRDNVRYGNTLQDQWIPDPAREPHIHALNSRPKGEQFAIETNLELPDMGSKSPRSSDILSKNDNEIHDLSVKRHPAKLLKVGFYQGSCINPHPGSFQIRNVQLNACLVQVWRQFGDGCIHNQLYNACNGLWDPNVNWTSCATQHAW